MFFKPLLLLLLLTVPIFAAEEDGDNDKPEENDTEFYATDTSSYYDENDSAARIMTYQFIHMNEHIGTNGLTLSGLFIAQQYNRYQDDPKLHTFGFGISGDILTGLPFIHLMPVFQYWSFTDSKSFGLITHSVSRDAGLAFNAVFLTSRLTPRMFRLFAGGGPSLHLTLLSEYDATNQTKITPGFRNGFSLLGGIELPLSNLLSFVVTGTYKQTYDWDLLYRKFLVLSVGLAI